MTVIKSYRDLLVWQKAVTLGVNCYALTKRFPATERYGLASQIQRAAVSIAANIAEGHGRSGPAVFLQHLSIARGSLRELETLLLLADRLGYSKAETSRELAAATDEIGKMLYGLSSRVSGDRASQSSHRQLLPDSRQQESPVDTTHGIT